MSSGDYKSSENEDIENSDESDRPSGERWAPVGANDGDDFPDEYKYIEVEKWVFDFSQTLLFILVPCKCYSTVFMLSTSLSYDMERLKMLEEEQEMLNSSLIALTTHFAQVFE